MCLFSPQNMNIKKVKCRRQLIKRTIVSLSLSIVSHLDENHWDRLYFKSTCSPENLEEKKNLWLLNWSELNNLKFYAEKQTS